MYGETVKSLLLFSVRGWDDPKAIVRPEGYVKFKKSTEMPIKKFYEW